MAVKVDRETCRTTALNSELFKEHNLKSEDEYEEKIDNLFFYILLYCYRVIHCINMM
jgi:hypothetical protein